MEKYGPLSQLVWYATNLSAAVLALRAMALGRALWEPKVAGFPRAPVRISGIGAMALVAVIFAMSRKETELGFWIHWVLGCFVPALLLFVADIALRTHLIITCPGAQTGRFGGLWKTRRARQILLGAVEAYDRGDLARGDPPPASAQTLYCSFPVPRDASRVWPSSSIATATAFVVFVYCVWNMLSVATLAVAATLIATALNT